MKKYSLFLMLFSILTSVLVTNCKKDPSPPTVVTSAVSEVTVSTATAGGTVTDDGGDGVTDKGVAYGTTSDPSLEGSFVSAGSGSSDFSVTLENLAEGTTYYVRAYATNSAGTSYGSQESFTTVTATVAVLETKPVTEVTTTTAVTGGNITNDGGSPITAKGVAWGTAENPTVENAHTSDGQGSESFNSNLTELVPGTTYYVRAYASNSKGTAYGPQVTFTTAAGLATLTTKEATEVSFSSASSGGTISDNGGSAITAKGIVWGTAENPTLENSFTTDGAGSEEFTSSLTNLTQSTTYYLRAYATNDVGTAYGNQVTFTTTSGVATLTTKEATEVTFSSASSGGTISSNGGSEITAKGVVWGTAENPTLENDFTTNGAGSDEFTSSLTNLTPATTYYVRAYATNAVGTAFGNQVTFTTGAAEGPVVTTTPLSSLTSSSVASGGNVTNSGAAPVTARGVVWGTTPNPTIAGSRTSNGSGTGAFTSNVTGLSNGTVYYLRAYATNSVGTSYGEEVTFITPVTDIEGNVYRTVKIGDQVWMAENLETTRYRNNTPIPLVTGTAQWIALDTLGTAAYTWYANNVANKDTYGGLYNWFAVATGNLCPAGWHVPTEAEFQTMERTLGVPVDSLNFWGWRGVNMGTHLKDTIGWTGGNGDNTSGFTAVPAGYRMWVDGSFNGAGTIIYIWLATDDAVNGKPEVAWYRRLDAGDDRIYKATTHKGGGKSIRCVKD